MRLEHPYEFVQGKTPLLISMPHPGLLLPEELLTVGTTTLWKLMVVFPALLVIGILAVIFGVVFPNRRFSPVQRRSVDLLEAVLIASVLPLALGVMDLYMTIRDLNLNLF